MIQAVYNTSRIICNTAQAIYNISYMTYAAAQSPLQLSPGHGPHFSSYQQRYRTAGSSNCAGFDHYYQYHGHYCQIMHIHNRKNVNSSRRMVCRTRTMLTNNSRTNSSLHSRQPRTDFPSDYSHIIASTHLEALLVSTLLVYN